MFFALMLLQSKMNCLKMLILLFLSPRSGNISNHICFPRPSDHSFVFTWCLYGNDY